MQAIVAIGRVMPDVDEAIGYCTAVPGFVLCEDRAMAPGKRWDLVEPTDAADS